MKSDRRILFCSREIGPWMDRDHEILERNFDTRRVFANNDYLMSLRWIRDLLWCEMLYLWFASYFTLPIVLLARILGRKIVIVTGGYDVAKADAINHGTYSKGFWAKTLRTLILKRADHILCVSDFNRREAIQNAGLPGDICETVYLSVKAPTGLKLHEWSQRKNQVVMVASATASSYRTKGVDQLLALAKYMPEVDFILVGSLDSGAREPIHRANLKNLKCLGFIEYHSPRFLDLLNESKVAVQLSYYESFGAAIVDAGLCGCEMVVFDRGALPEVVSPRGHVVPYGDLGRLEEKLKELFDHPSSDLTVRAQELRDRFNPSQREKALVASLTRLFA